MRMQLFVLLAVCGFTLIGRWAPQNVQSQKSGEVQPKPIPTRERDLTRFPLIEFASETNDDESRKQKDRRYERYTPFVIGGDPDPRTGLQLVVDHVKRPDAIPADADLVIVGQVLSGSAHLTNGKRSIYSEFVIRVDEVVKQDRSKEIVIAETVVADRLGGRIRFQNGQEVTYGAEGFDMPGIGKQHVFFLARDDKSPNYKIITGYELIGEVVQPIDRFDSTKISTEKTTFLKQIRLPATPKPQDQGGSGLAVHF
jgi:hypothetical protein